MTMADEKERFGTKKELTHIWPALATIAQGRHAPLYPESHEKYAFLSSRRK